MMKEVKTPSTIGIASDHAGFALKQFVKKYLEEKGFEYKDYGTYTEDSCDYSPPKSFTNMRDISTRCFAFELG